jgi:hypothetical protein
MPSELFFMIDVRKFYFHFILLILFIYLFLALILLSTDYEKLCVKKLDGQKPDFTILGLVTSCPIFIVAECVWRTFKGINRSTGTYCNNGTS